MIESPTGGHRRPPTFFFQRLLKRVVSFSDFWLWRRLLKLLAAFWGALGSFWVVSGGSLVGFGVLLVASFGSSWVASRTSFVLFVVFRFYSAVARSRPY